jgi:rhamnose utilization protein RhaD (predicted bifunctional aldolase and dehydrogenase)/NAD(P)-dependent dehydrogenase (short-subunit alcohol dehydrogenase family)
MPSAWVEADAAAVVARLAADGVAPDLALRIYSARLLGGDRRLVLHGGGNSSLKTRLPDPFGDEHAVLCVKASGRDMATITPDGFPAVRLDLLTRVLAREDIGDAEWLRLVRAALLDPFAPDPSVEILLHAALPPVYVDHTHANAVLSLVDQPDGAAVCAEVFGERIGFVPYCRPGFALAKRAAAIFAQNPRVEGLVLDKHGLFTFGATARDSYERHVALVDRAETHLRRGRTAVFPAAALPRAIAPVAEVAPILRGACALPDPKIEGAYLRLILAFRSSAAIRAFVDGKEIDRYARAGVVTPDHVIRTKGVPLIVPPPECGKLDAFAAAARAAVQTFSADYAAYFARHNARYAGRKTMLDPLPRVILVPGLGLFGLGRSAREAEIAADIAEAMVATITGAESIGRFQSISEAELFDCEYWALEQAKLGPAAAAPLAGQVAAITGAAGAIGAATARTFAAAGAEVALLDIDGAAAQARAHEIGGRALALACDVTDPESVRHAFARIADTFGGLDILVSNAGAAWQGRIGSVDEAVLRQSFELNFYGHQRCAQAAVRLFKAQGLGGCLLFNVSKQAVNPGPDFGPYGLPKAATLFLVRQYALDHGADGIRANAVNADRIRSGLLTDDFIRARAAARGVSERDYMSGNLLGREVTAEDVAQAFLHQALQLKTTADVTTVDGGNIAAALR